MVINFVKFNLSSLLTSIYKYIGHKVWIHDKKILIYKFQVYWFIGHEATSIYNMIIYKYGNKCTINEIKIRALGMKIITYVQCYQRYHERKEWYKRLCLSALWELHWLLFRLLNAGNGSQMAVEKRPVWQPSCGNQKGTQDDREACPGQST